MLDIAAAAGFSASTGVLDIGCGRGDRTVEIARRFHCRVAGIDPVERNLSLARTKAAEAGVTDLLSLHNGSIEAIPFGDRSFDHLWCRDVLVHVRDLPGGMKESARVLKPGGSMIVYTTFAPADLTAAEVEEICEPLGIVPENLSAAKMEGMIRKARLTIESTETVGSELTEFYEERDGRYSKELRRIARMIRKKDQFTRQLGRVRYHTALALYRWGVYQMLGRLSPRIYVLRRAGKK